MSEPRHISECITEWFDDYERQHMDPFNLPDALTAIRDELTAAREPETKRQPRDPAEVVAEHVTKENV